MKTSIMESWKSPIFLYDHKLLKISFTIIEGQFDIMYDMKGRCHTVGANQQH